MAIDKEKYIKKFIDEGLENIALVETLIFDIKDGVSIEDDLATLLRSLHTLKGTSRMLEFKRVEDLSHSLESVFVALREQRVGFSENALKLILSSLDILKAAFENMRKTNKDTVEIQDHVKNLALLASNDDFTVPEYARDNSAASSSSFINEESARDDNDGETINGNPAIQSKTVDSSPARRGLNANSENTPRKENKSESIRLSLEKIDSIIKSIASLQTLEISAKSLTQNSAALNNAIKDFSLSLKNLKKTDPAVIKEFRKLERLGGRLNASLKNYAIDAGNHVRGAYDSVISLRTLPISTLFDSYPRYVFQLSQELGKKVQLVIEGKENEIDKNIIESLSEVFIHMARNAVDHGLETPDERTASGKPETGKLSIICSRESGNMKIVISDDGRGIDLEKIREKAVKEGLVSKASAAGLSKEDLTNFIFQSGFSTSAKTNNISGRGVGLNIVRESVESLKGSVVVESVPSKGTSFTIIVPLSIAAITGFPVKCGGMKFIIPSNFAESVILLNRGEIITVVDRPEIKYNNRLIKLFFLSQILGIKDEAAQASDIIYTVIIRSYDDIAALAVDNIDSMRSVILKTIPSFMEKINIISGIAHNEDYEMISVLHIPAIIKIAKRIKTIDIKKRHIELEKSRKSILVVDDSPATREIEREILQSEGYMVDTAADGALALKAAKQKHYDLICTDLNMPVMDGFMLIENIKKNEELSGVPVIVISSIAVEEDQTRAFTLGASAYIVKSSFNNQNLLAAIKGLLGGDK